MTNGSPSTTGRASTGGTTVSVAPHQLATPTDLSAHNVRTIADAVNALIADAFALYVKTRTSTGTYQARTSAITICCSMSRPQRSSRRSIP